MLCQDALAERLSRENNCKLSLVFTNTPGDGEKLLFDASCDLWCLSKPSWAQYPDKLLEYLKNAVLLATRSPGEDDTEQLIHLLVELAETCKQSGMVNVAKLCLNHALELLYPLPEQGYADIWDHYSYLIMLVYARLDMHDELAHLLEINKQIQLRHVDVDGDLQ